MVGIQAQDLRAMGLALRSRVPGLERAALLGRSDLIRTWTVRGTVHLIAAADLPLLQTAIGARNRRVYEGLMSKRGNLDVARSMRPVLIELLAEHGPMTRARLLERFAERSDASLGPRSVNVLMPWLAAAGDIVGLPDGRFRPADPLAELDPDEALATLARRYLAGYGPAGSADLAKWSGLSLSAARRSFEALGELERAGEDLFVLPGTLDAEPPAPPALLLAPFDTALLGWRTREPLVAASHDGHVLPGGGVVKATLLARGRAAATWRVAGSGKRRRLELEPFARLPAAAALRAEVADVGRFLGLELELAA